MRRDLTPLVYTVDDMLERDTRVAEKRLGTLMAEKWRREYSKMVGFVRVWMSLSVVRANTLILVGEWGNRGLMGRGPVCDKIQG